MKEKDLDTEESLVQTGDRAVIHESPCQMKGKVLSGGIESSSSFRREGHSVIRIFVKERQVSQGYYVTE